MRPLNKARQTECLTPEGWVPVHWEQLDVGDTVRFLKALDEVDPHVTDEEYVVELVGMPYLKIDPVKSEEEKQQ